MAARAAILPNWVADKDLSDPPKQPTGVRTALAITTSYFIFKDTQKHLFISYIQLYYILLFYKYMQIFTLGPVVVAKVRF